MYHNRFQKSHYEAGYHWGNLLYQKGIQLRQGTAFAITADRISFAEKCLPIYEQYYPEILTEIKGLAEGQRDSYRDLCTFLMGMYCFEVQNHCTCFVFQDKDHLIFARNSDFLTALEKLYMNCLYRLNSAYAFNGNTTAFIEMEDGINEHGLAVGLTFLYPKVTDAGLNAGMLVRYLLEKCKTTDEAIDQLNRIPIASQQTLTIADPSGNFAVIECNCRQLAIRKPTKQEPFVVAANSFTSQEMLAYNTADIDNWRSDERYTAARNALRTEKASYCFNLAKDILSGKHGFMCQYDRHKGADTVWSVIYDIKNRQIFRVEGNPSRRKFIEDSRMKFT